MVFKGRPQRLKVVYCTHCDHSLEVSPRALSVNCPHCQRRVVVEALKIKSYHAVTLLATCGKVEVLRRGHVVARIKADELVVRGKVYGDVTARTRIAVGKYGKLHGDICTPKLAVESGGELVGHCYVAPDAVQGKAAT